MVKTDENNKILAKNVMKFDNNKFCKLQEVFEKPFINQLYAYDITNDMEVQIEDGKNFKTDSVKFSGQISSSNDFIVLKFR